MSLEYNYPYSSPTATEFSSTIRDAMDNVPGDTVNASDFGIVANCKTSLTGSMTNGSDVLTTTGNPTFLTDIVGQTIFVTNGISSTAPATVLATTIKARLSANSVQLNAPATMDYTAATVYWGTLNFAPLQAAFAASDGKTLVIPPGTYMLGSFNAGLTGLFTFVSIFPKRVLGDGATFVLNSNVLMAEPVIFNIGNDPRVDSLYVCGFTSIDVGADPTNDGVTNRRGQYFADISVISRGVRNIVFEGVTVLGAHSGMALQISGFESYGITWGTPGRPCFVQDAIYNAVINNTRKAVTYSHSKACRRAVYFNGCRDFVGDLTAETNRPSTAIALVNGDGTIGDCLRGRVSVDCKGLRDNTAGASLTAPTFHVSVVDNTGTVRIEDVVMVGRDFDDTAAVYLLQTSVYLTGGAAAAGAATNVFRGLSCNSQGGRSKAGLKVDTVLTPVCFVEVGHATYSRWKAGLNSTNGTWMRCGPAMGSIRTTTSMAAPFAIPFDDLVDGMYAYEIRALLQDWGISGYADDTKARTWWRRVVSFTVGSATLGLHPAKANQPATFLLLNANVIQDAAMDYSTSGGNITIFGVPANGIYDNSTTHVRLEVEAVRC